MAKRSPDLSFRRLALLGDMYHLALLTLVSHSAQPQGGRFSTACCLRDRWEPPRRPAMTLTLLFLLRVLRGCHGIEQTALEYVA